MGCLSTYQCAAYNNDLAAVPYLTGKNIARIDDTGIFSESRDRRAFILSSGCQNDMIRIEFPDIFQRCLGIVADLYAKLFALNGLPYEEVRDLSLPGRNSRIEKLASVVALFFKNSDVMSSFCRIDRRFKASGASADNDNFLLLVCRLDASLVFEAKLGIEHTLNRLVCQEHADTSYVAAEAAANIFKSSLFCLIGHCGICQGGSAHTHEISLAGRDDGIRKERIVDTANNGYRNTNCLFDGSSMLCNQTMCSVPTRDIPIESQIVSEGNMNHINAGFLHHSGNRLRVLNGQTAFNKFTAGKPDVDHEILTASFAYVLDHFSDKTRAVPEIAAVFVKSLVGIGREELRDKIAVCRVNLNAVKTRFFCTFCCVSELLNNFFDLLCGKRLRHHITERTCDP